MVAYGVCSTDGSPVQYKFMSFLMWHVFSYSFFMQEASYFIYLLDK